MAGDKVPTGLALTPIDDTFRQNPYPVLEQLRESEPVHHDTDLQRYFFTQYDDVKQILRNARYWSDPHKSKPNSYARFLLRNEEEDVSMLLADEPDHRRLRMLVNDIFTPRAVRKWHDRIVDVIESRLAAIDEPEFDLIKEYAGPIPTIVIAEMLGIGTEHHAQFKQWSDTAVAVGFNPQPTEQELVEADVARSSLSNFFAEQIELRKTEPGPDLISQMLNSQKEGEQLTEEEIIAQCDLLLIAGNVTTTDMIGNGIKALLDHPEQLEKLRSNPGLIDAALEEILRYDSPVINSGRITNSNIEIKGCPIEQGESLSVSLGAANRDPAVYTDPNTFNIEREQIPHQAFGGGRHHCLGASLARLEGKEAILRLLQRFPRLRLSDKGHEYSGIPAFRGLAYCWLRND